MYTVLFLNKGIHLYIRDKKANQIDTLEFKLFFHLFTILIWLQKIPKIPSRCCITILQM